MPIRRIEMWHFTVTDPQTGRRYTPRYRMTMEEARARYKNPEVVIYSLEIREVDDDAPGHGQAITVNTRSPACPRNDTGA